MRPPTSLGPVVTRDANGEFFEPPRRAQWWGMLGAFSRPKNHNIGAAEARAPGMNMHDQCIALAEDFSEPGVVVHAWPYMADSFPRDPNQLYEGSVKLNFMHSNYKVCIEND